MNNAQHTPTPTPQYKPGFNLTILPNGGFEVAEFIPAGNQVFIGPACYFPVSEAELAAQVKFYGTHRTTDRRAALAKAGQS